MPSGDIECHRVTSGALGCHRVVFGDSLFDIPETPFFQRMEFNRDPPIESVFPSKSIPDGLVWELSRG